MESANNTEATLSLLESGRESNFSTQTYDRDQLERLKNRVRILESENAELQRIQPRLLDAQGKDYTEEFANLAKKLQMSQDNCEGWECEHRKLLKKYTDLEQGALAQIDQRDKEIDALRLKAMDLEEENSKLREQLQDEQSRIHNLQAGQLNQSLNKLHLRDQIDNSLAKIHGQALQNFSAQFNESFGDLDVNDDDQIAAHIFMILERLDKNARNSEELRAAIFAFLTERGFDADPQKFAMFINIYKEAVSKRQADIRNANDRLMRSKLGSISVGGDKEEFEACLRQLYQQDSISIMSNNTFPSFAGMAVTQQSEQSVMEPGGELQHNATIESVAAMHLAGRTTNLAEACIRMFEKLRGTAEFFQQLLKHIGVTNDELGEELMRKIESMKLDLDKSMGEARSIIDEAKNAERNLRSLLAEQSQLDINSTAYTTMNESKLQQQQQDAAINTTSDVQLKARPQECQKCHETDALKSALNNELEHKKQLNTELATSEEQNEQFQQEIEKLENKIQELETKMCEKCAELEELFQSAQSALDTEIEEKKQLAEKMAELADMNKKLQEEKEQLSSSVKENQPIPRAQIVDGIREELNSIYDTMSFASSLCSSTALASSQKTRLKSKSSSGNKRAAPHASQQPGSSSKRTE